MSERRHSPVDAFGVAHVDHGVRGWEVDIDILGRRPRWGGEPDTGRPAHDRRGNRIYGPDGRDLFEPLGSAEPYAPAPPEPRRGRGAGAPGASPAIAERVAAAVVAVVSAVAGAIGRRSGGSRSR